MLIALLPLLAVGGVIEPGVGSKLLGWSADGQSLVWTSTETSTSSPKAYFLPKGDDRVEIKDPSKLSAEDRAKLVVDDPTMGMGSQDDETVVIATVHDVRRGDDQRFLIKYKVLSQEGRTAAVLKKKYASLPDAAAFETWKKAHPLSKTANRKGPQGGTVAITVKGTGDDGASFTPPTWSKNTMSWQVETTVAAALAATCGKDTATETLEQTMAGMYAPTWTTTPYWDPTGHRVLFALEESVVKTMRGPDGGRINYLIVPCGPRVEVVAPANLDKMTGPVADAVEKAGFTVVSIGPAKAQRTATVIYADPAHTEVAAKLIAAIPGGATVDKLTWKPKADIVVAIGDSAK